MIPIETIVSCESDDNYTNIKLKNEQKAFGDTFLKDIEEALEQHPLSVFIVPILSISMKLKNTLKAKAVI
jgi:hypothetical protein